MKNRHYDPNRRKAIAVFMAFGFTTAFLILLSIPFGHGVGTILVILLAIVALGILRKKCPGLFNALKRSKLPIDEGPKPIHGSIHPELQRTYVMLIGLNTSEASRIAINKSPFIVGNSDEADFKVTDAYVSRTHMSIEFDDASKQRFVTDLSRNGTFLNGNRLTKGEKHPILHGDTLMIGSAAFTVEFVYY